MAMKKEENEESHVLMVAFASQGHINPMLRLGKCLVSKGLHVTLATTEIARQRILKSTTTTTEIGRQRILKSTTTTTESSIAGIDLEFFSDGLNLDYDRKSNIDHYMDTLRKHGPTNLSKLIQDNLSQNKKGAAAKPKKKFSCIINNPFVPWVADVAAEHGIPCAMLWIQPSTLYAIYYRFYNNLNSFPTENNPDMKVELPGLPLLLPTDLPSFVLPKNPFDSFPKLFSELFRNMKKYKWVLGNSFYELEKEVIDSMSELCPIRPIGPLVPPTLLIDDDHEEESRNHDIGIDMWKPENACMDWLNKQPPSSVVYVSFGSIVMLSKKQMENIANGLMNSNRRFLWVVKPPDHPVSNDGGQFPLGFLEETKERGLIVAWSPQTRVLSHPSVACFLSHCGWNSTLEAVAAGVPVIACPQWTDQPTNAKLIVDVFKLGLRLKLDDDGLVSEEEVEKCIEEITGGNRTVEFKKKATELKKSAREAVAAKVGGRGGGSSETNIQLFVDEIKASNSCTTRKSLA